MTPERKNLVEDVLEDIRSIFRRITTAARSDMHQDAIPRSQAIVMHIVSANPGMSVKDVASAMDISASAATQLIENLVKLGIIVRTPSQQDRRVVALVLSKYGRSRHRKYKAFQLARLHPLMDALTDEELVEFSRLYSKLITASATQPAFRSFIPHRSHNKE